MADVTVKPVWALKLKDGKFNSRDTRNPPFPRLYERRKTAVEDKKLYKYSGDITRLELVLREPA